MHRVDRGKNEEEEEIEQHKSEIKEGGSRVRRVGCFISYTSILGDIFWIGVP